MDTVIVSTLSEFIEETEFPCKRCADPTFLSVSH